MISKTPEFEFLLKDLFLIQHQLVAYNKPFPNGDL